MLNSIFRSLKKSWRLKKISKQLSSKTDTNDLAHLLFNNKDKAVKDLLEICKSDEKVMYLIKEYNVNDQKLKSLFNKLNRSGAGQYAGGHYVAASSLCYAPTLKFLLQHFDGEIFSIKNYDEYNSSLFIVNRLIKYFEKGEAGEVRY